MDSLGKINIKSFCFNLFQENCYLLWDKGGSCVIIDPGNHGVLETGSLKDFIASKGLSPKAIWLTHGHFDHIYGVAELSREYSIPVYMSPDDGQTLGKGNDSCVRYGLELPDTSFETRDILEGDELSLGQDDIPGNPSFKVIATPGHTPGGVCFYDEEDGVLITGDTLFAGSIGRTDLWGGDYDKEILSIMEKLMDLPGSVEVFPGHGPQTSIAAERTTNPFLQPFNEPWDNEID